MASDKAQLDFTLDQMAGAGALRARSMFGEYAVYCDGKVVALFCDNLLYVKPTLGGRDFFAREGLAPTEAPPYPGAKNYFLVEDRIEDRDFLRELIRVTTREVPAGKVKKGEKGKKAPPSSREGSPKKKGKGPSAVKAKKASPPTPEPKKKTRKS